MYLITRWKKLRTSLAPLWAVSNPLSNVVEPKLAALPAQSPRSRTENAEIDGLLHLYVGTDSTAAIGMDSANSSVPTRALRVADRFTGRLSGILGQRLA